MWAALVVLTRNVREAFNPLMNDAGQSVFQPGGWPKPLILDILFLKPFHRHFEAISSVAKECIRQNKRRIVRSNQPRSAPEHTINKVRFEGP
jgi:hypothetical protein